jgi:ABC-2 type transport system ATP-binding protein
MLAELPEVRRITRSGPAVIVAGTGDLVHALTSVLARNQIVAHELRIEQADLDDAFIALTGRKLNREGEPYDKAGKDNHGRAEVVLP